MNKIHIYLSKIGKKIFKRKNSYFNGIFFDFVDGRKTRFFLAYEFDLTLQIDKNKNSITLFEKDEKILEIKKISKRNIKKTLKKIRLYLKNRMTFHFYNENNEWINSYYFNTSHEYNEEEINNFIYQYEPLSDKEKREKIVYMIVQFGYDGILRRYRQIRNKRFYYFDNEITINDGYKIREKMRNYYEEKYQNDN